jgi:hypothetical protein
MALRYGLIAMLATASLALAGAASTAPATGSPTGGKCGGLPGLKCGSDKDYCMLKPGQCPIADAQGVCKTKPQICNKIYLPVCGCDEKTYGNACEASVGVMSKGKCKAKASKG